MTPFMCKALDQWIDSETERHLGKEPPFIELTMVQYKCLVHELVLLMPYLIPVEPAGTGPPTYRGVPIEIKP